MKIYKCIVCGKECFKKISLYGYSPLCSKHMHQILKYHKPLDDSPRTVHDLNEFRKLDESTYEFDLYNTNGYKISSFLISPEDLNFVRYKKWRLSHGCYVITGSKSKGGSKLLSRLLLGVTDDSIVVDHINGNALDNRRSNLRICTHVDNTYNKSMMTLNTSGFIGISKDKRRDNNSWLAEVRYKNKRFRMGSWNLIEEAVYARYVSTQILFKEYRNTNNDESILDTISKISDIRKNQIKEWCMNKINKKLQEFNIDE
jgi:hypothetical protein